VGSGFAGVKAGVLAGIVYIGSLALFNVLLLYVLKQDALHVISEQYPQVCSSAPAANSTSVEDCFSSVVTGYVPFLAFIGFFVSLIYAWVFGRVYEYFPAKGARTRGLMIAFVVLINLLYFGLIGIPFDQTAATALAIFALSMTVVYGVLMGTFYSRYTRRVDFGGGDLRIMVDGKDMTGKSRTFATKSVHELRAEPKAGNSFRVWVVSGGVTVEDNKSFETTMEVNGDGLLKAEWKKQ
jgi:hypothetical protein